MPTTKAPISEQYGKQHILYTADVGSPITTDWFEPSYWQQRDALSSVGTGRGAAWFIHDSEQDQDYVLRHFRRGGLIAKLSKDRYIWTGLDNTRAWREWTLLNYIQECGLPGPRPLAARVIRHGLFYTADILTYRIQNTRALSDCLTDQKLSAATWKSIGSCIRQFHAAHVYHADLNAHNILLNSDLDVSIIDFDKGRIDQSSAWQQKNLQRLQRSLTKLSGLMSGFNYCEDDWDALEKGYFSEVSS